jgi:hypothetical protein
LIAALEINSLANRIDGKMFIAPMPDIYPGIFNLAG